MDAYEIVSVVGEGRYGFVYKCRCKSTGAICAVKRFKEMHRNEYAMRAMIRELRILNMLRGEPNVVQLTRALREKGRLYLVMEYVEANLLDVLRRSSSGVPLSQLRQLLFTLLVGVRSCHSNGIIHRDLKPENILVRYGFSSVVCDFSVSRAVGFPQAATTTSGSLLETPKGQLPPLTEYVATRWYRSPEMLLGAPRYSYASDIWAVGTVMAELALGEPLFPGKSEDEQLTLIRQRVGEFPSSMMQGSRCISMARAEQSAQTKHCKTRAEMTGDYLGCQYCEVLGENGLSLLRSLLTIDPSKRFTVDEALSHPFFEGMALRCVPSPRKVSLSKPTSTTAGPAPSPNAATNSVVRVDGCDKWFDLGEGKPVRLEEIEPFHRAGTVEPRVLPTLSIEVETTHVSPFSRTRINADGAAARLTGSSIASSCTDGSANEEASENTNSPTNYALRLPNISSNLSCFLLDFSPEYYSSSSYFPIISKTASPLRPLNHLACTSGLSSTRLGHMRPPDIKKRVSFPVSFLPQTLSNAKKNDSSNFNAENPVECNNKAQNTGIKVPRQLTLKRRGRLVFTTKPSVDGL
ncbi:putative protein kinase [Trypanosoma rangeli]|uniref:cyclin-dependent kinase n=1 Tax=Trypanosoma rangeli TaxID=5698 RepID=A0A3R7LCG7_TRYRA|nr:putative protein kinase [Trypanosoma rangeli]RNF11623.1 putative protein kinase [Trypanosoma rangeli]|eukprot:RNF11623.1 putative protein kinase [Trypanosoma rangeli]